MSGQSSIGGGWIDTGTVVRLVTASNIVVLGATAPLGAEKQRIVGGIGLDDAATLSAFIEMRQGQSAPVSGGAGIGRIRYNSPLNQFEMSLGGAPYISIAGGPPGGAGWTDDGVVVRLTTITDSVGVGTALPAAKLHTVSTADVPTLRGTMMLAQTAGAILLENSTLTPVFSVGATGRTEVNRIAGAPVGNSALVVNDLNASPGRVNYCVAISDSNTGTGPGLLVERLGIGGAAAVVVKATAPTTSAIEAGTGGGTNALLRGTGQLVVGGSTFVGMEQFRCVGDGRVEGKLTVTGVIDPTAIFLVNTVPAQNIVRATMAPAQLAFPVLVEDSALVQKFAVDTFGEVQTAQGLRLGAPPVLFLSGPAQAAITYDFLGFPPDGKLRVSFNGTAYQTLATSSDITLQAAYVGGQFISENTTGMTIGRAAGPLGDDVLGITYTLIGGTGRTLFVSSNNGALPFQASAIDAVAGTSRVARLQHYNFGVGANGVAAAIDFSVRNGLGTERDGARISGGLSDVTDLAEDGYVQFSVMHAGALVDPVILDGEGGGGTVDLLTVEDAAINASSVLRLIRSNLFVGDTLLAETATAGGRVWHSQVIAGAGTAAIFGDGDTVFGGDTMSGTEKLRVVGDTRGEGNTTATGFFAAQAVSPAALPSGATPVNNYAGLDGKGFGRITVDVTGSILTGIANGVDGRKITIVNVAGGGTLTLNNLDAGSAAANQFLTSTGANIVLATNGIAFLVYDATDLKWRVTT